MSSNKVVWTEGMFLNPHHFQQSDHYQESLAQQRTDYLLPFTWGIYDISCDEDAVKNGIFVVNKLQGLMPDGSFLDIGEIDPLPDSRSFQDVFTPSTDSIDVYIAIPLYMPDRIVCNLDNENKTKATRYRREFITVFDENTASNEQTIPIAKKNIKILFSGESLDGFSSIKVAKINRLADGFAFDEDYIPPLLNIKASRTLMKIVRRILENLSARSTELSATRRQRSTEMADFTPSDISNFLFLQTINSFIPLINHFHRREAGHPEQLYKVLVQLAGELMTFSVEGHPRDLAAYNHSDLQSTFSAIDNRLQALLGRVISAQNFVSVPLERKTENIYTGTIQDENLFAIGKFFLAITSDDVPQADIIKFVPAKLKISSAETINDILNAAMPGVGISHLHVPPSALPIKVGYEYFKLESSGELWALIKESKNIAIYVPKDLVAIELKLIILKGQ